jgi:hypothetical protein
MLILLIYLIVKNLEIAILQKRTYNYFIPFLVAGINTIKTPEKGFVIFFWCFY